MLGIQLTALALAAVTLAASGCGGSSKSSTTANSAIATSTQPTTAAQTSTTTPTTEAVTTKKEIKIQAGPPLTQAVWIKKGDAVCAHTLAQLKSTSTSGKSVQGFARGLTQVLAYERIELGELSKIVPPADKTSDWLQIVTGLQRFTELSAQVEKYAQVNKITTAQPIIEAANTTSKQVRLIAKRDGFKACGVS